jgi:hypothetical protein
MAAAASRRHPWPRPNNTGPHRARALQITATLASCGGDRATASVDPPGTSARGRWRYPAAPTCCPGTAPRGWLVQWSPSVAPQLGAGNAGAAHRTSRRSSTAAARRFGRDAGGHRAADRKPRATWRRSRPSGGCARPDRPGDPGVHHRRGDEDPDGQATVAVLRQATTCASERHPRAPAWFTSASDSSPRAGFARQVLPPSVAGRGEQTPARWSVLAVDDRQHDQALVKRPSGHDRRHQPRPAIRPRPRTPSSRFPAHRARGRRPSTGDILAVAQNGPADAAGASR